jgi:hypothetical protein
MVKHIVPAPKARKEPKTHLDSKDRVRFGTYQVENDTAVNFAE